MTRVQVQIGGSVRPRTNLFNNPRRWHPTRRPSPIFTPSAPRSGPLAPALKKIRSVLKLMSKNLHTQMYGQWIARVRGRTVMTTLLPPNNDVTVSTCSDRGDSRAFSIRGKLSEKKIELKLKIRSLTLILSERAKRAQLDNICRAGEGCRPYAMPFLFWPALAPLPPSFVQLHLNNYWFFSVYRWLFRMLLVDYVFFFISFISRADVSVAKCDYISTEYKF